MNKTDFFLNLIASLRVIGVQDIMDAGYPIELGVKAALEKAAELKVKLDFKPVAFSYLTRAGLQNCKLYGVIESKWGSSRHRIGMKFPSPASAEDYMKHRDPKVDVETWKLIAEEFLDKFEEAVREEQTYRDRLGARADEQ